MKTLRFGCVGCGSMGALHVHNALHVPGMKVVAYADPDRSAAERFLGIFGGEYATNDPQELFDDGSIDAVLIQTGERYHPQLGIAAALAGKHIFMEKPVALTMGGAMELRAAIHEAGVKCLIGLCNRLAPMVRKAVDVLPRPWITLGQCSDTVSEQACHNLDLIVHAFHRAPLLTIYAVGGRHYDLDPHLPGDSFTATLKFADDSQATYVQHGKAYNNTMRKYSFQLFGRDRTVFLAERFKRCIVSSSYEGNDLEYRFEGPDFSRPPIDDLEGHFRNSRGPHGYMGHYDELVDLCRSIREDREPAMTIDHGVNVLAVERAIFESIGTGQIVDYRAFLTPWGFEQPADAQAAL